jgi:hypothetical protein
MNQTKNTIEKDVRETLIGMIQIEFGNYAASLYKDFYNKEPIDKIVVSANELFSEMIGEVKAKEKLDPVWKKLNIKNEK